VVLALWWRRLARTPLWGRDHPLQHDDGVLALFEDGMQTPVLLADVVPVEDADLTTAGGRLLSVPASAAMEITPVERTS
jgi:hypothetical protein